MNRKRAGRRGANVMRLILLIAICLALATTASVGVIEGHLASRVENGGNGFSAAAQFNGAGGD